MRNLLFFIFIFLFGSVLAQNPKPSVNCVVVNDDGTITVNYSAIDPTTITTFTTYKYSALTGGDYVERGTETDASVNTFTFPSSENGNNLSVSIRITAEYNDLLGVDQSETVNANSIYLILSNQTSTSIDLSWNNLGSDVVGSETESFKVYRKFKKTDNDWVFVADVTNDGNPNYTFTDIFGEVCFDSLFYRIEIDNSSGCKSISNKSVIEVGDEDNPNPPTIPYITVDLNTQTPVLNWTRSNSNDTYGYVICQGNPCIAIDTVWDQNYYDCNTCDATEINSLAVMAFDTCMNSSTRTDQHSNILLKYTRPNCSVTLNLDWTNYSNIPGGVLKYKIMGSQNDEAFTEYATLGSSQREYTLTLNPTVQKYCFYILAESNDGIISLSNKICTSQDQGRQVEYNYIRSVEVDDNNASVKLSFYVDASVVTSSYELYRAENEGEFVKIANVPYSGNDSFTYVDKLPSPANKSTYRYYLYVPDECGLIYTQSNIVNTIQLLLEATTTQKNILTWNDVIGWNCNTYDVYRVTDSENGPELIGSSISGTYGYEDDISNLVSASDRLYYYVVGRESGTPVDGEEAISKSSRSLIVKESLVWVPNSIYITDNANNRFAPVCSFIRDGSYRFVIFTRHGTKIFESTTPNEAWDGKYNDEYLRPGVLVYFLEYVNSYGEKVQKGGTINYLN